MECKVIEGYSSHLETNIGDWLLKKPGIKITHITQCSLSVRELNSLSTPNDMIVVTILYEHEDK